MLYHLIRVGSSVMVINNAVLVNDIDGDLVAQSQLLTNLIKNFICETASGNDKIVFTVEVKAQFYN